MKRLFEKLAQTIGVAGMMLVCLAYAFGGIAGAIWAALKDDLLNVVLSILIPFYGAGYVVYQVFDFDGADEKAWIVLDFATTTGTVAQMTFRAPNPDITLEECEFVLKSGTANLVESAHATEPKLATAKFLGANCVMSVEDPIKP